MNETVPLGLSPPRRLIAAMAARPRATAVLVTLTLTVVLIVALPRPLGSDVSGQLWIADRLRHGARLYLDISEINPPLWFWLAMPVDALAEGFGIGADGVLIGVLGGAALASLLATDALAEHRTPAMRTALLIYGSLILLVMPARDLGQREQIALMGALPFAALMAARRQGRSVAPWLAVLVASGAATGFALKHYFAIIPVLLEIWLIAGLRRDWRPLRPELLVLTVGAVTYLAAILIVTPDYLRLSVPEAALAYGAIAAPDAFAMIRPAQPVWVLIGCALAVTCKADGRTLSPTAVALLIAGLGFALGWAIQHKGWPYHSIATTGMLAMAMAVSVPVGKTSDPRVRLRPITVAALIVPILLAAVPTQWVPTPATDIAPALSDLNRGDTVAIVAKEGRTVWPSTVNRGFRFVGRHTSFWELAAVDAWGARDPRIAALGRRVVTETVIDYRCLPPGRIVFAPRSPGRTGGATGAGAAGDPLRYFLREPEFARLLTRYRRLDRPGNFDAFQLVRPPKPLPVGIVAVSCPRGA